MRYVTIVALFFLPTKLLFSQSERHLSVSVVLENDSLYAFDPWRIQIVITNISTVPLKILPISAEQGRINKLGFLDLEFLTDQDSVWESTRQILNYHNEYASSYISPIRDVMVELKPNQSLSATYFLAPTLPLTSGNFIKIRAEYFFPAIGHNIFSPVQTIYLKNYGEIDNLAYQYLKTLPRPYFLFLPFYPVFYDKTDMGRAEDLVKQFPKSKFALYANLFLAQGYLGMALSAIQNDKNPTQALVYLRRCKFHGFIVLESHEPKFVKKSEEILAQMIGVLFQMYDEDTEPPMPLVQEFLYPPKH